LTCGKCECYAAPQALLLMNTFQMCSAIVREMSNPFVFPIFFQYESSCAVVSCALQTVVSTGSMAQRISAPAHIGYYVENKLHNVPERSQPPHSAIRSKLLPSIHHLGEDAISRRMG